MVYGVHLDSVIVNVAETAAPRQRLHTRLSLGGAALRVMNHAGEIRRLLKAASGGKGTPSSFSAPYGSY
jgi:hypothetical protein